MGSLFLWTPYILSKKQKFFAFGLALSLLGLNQLILIRVGFLRPHVLAMLLFTVLLWGMLRHWKWLLFIFALLFSLSYHAIYIPLLLSFFLFCVYYSVNWIRLRNSKIELERVLFVQAYAIVAGTIVGAIVNPYFPSNLIRMLQHLALAIRGDSLAAKMHFELGAELVPFSTPEFINQCGVFSVALFLGLFALVWKLAKQRYISSFTIVFALLSTALWIACFYSPRAAEFALPVVVVFLFQLFQKVTQKKQLILIGVLSILHIIPLASILQKAKYPSVAPTELAIADVLKSVPENSSISIYHCNWGLGSYLFYLRPQAKIIDLLDPSFLLLFSPEKYFLRTTLNMGRISDPVKTIKEVFKSDYVLCGNLPLSQQLMKSKNNQYLGSDKSKTHHLFRLL